VKPDFTNVKPDFTPNKRWEPRDTRMDRNAGARPGLLRLAEPRSGGNTHRDGAGTRSRDGRATGTDLCRLKSQLCRVTSHLRRDGNDETHEWIGTLGRDRACCGSQSRAPGETRTGTGASTPHPYIPLPDRGGEGGLWALRVTENRVKQFSEIFSCFSMRLVALRGTWLRVVACPVSSGFWEQKESRKRCAITALARTGTRSVRNEGKAW
jgi:hypothetical protein